MALLAPDTMSKPIVMPFYRWRLLPLAVLSAAMLRAAAAADSAPLGSPPGVVIDDPAAEKTGAWRSSTHVGPFVGPGYIHDDNRDKGEMRVRFVARPPATGRYQVLLAYTPGKTLRLECADLDHDRRRARRAYAQPA